MLLLLAIVGISVFISIAFLGIAHSSFGMEMNGRGQMSGCFFDGYAKICAMTLSEHIKTWQNVFTAIPSKTTHLAFAFLLLGFTCIGAFMGRRYLLDREKLLSQNHCPIHNLDSPIFNFLKELFSQGILNPRVY